jgi:hypothetical protein
MVPNRAWGAGVPRVLVPGAWCPVPVLCTVDCETFQKNKKPAHFVAGFAT